MQTKLSQCPLGNLESIFARKQKRLETISKIIGHIDGGAILKHGRQDSWEFILPDIDGGGRWRAQHFTENGFSGHSVYLSLDEAINACIRDGYIRRDDGALDRLQNTPLFKRGNFINNLIMLVNSSKITMQEGHHRLKCYDEGVHASDAIH